MIRALKPGASAALLSLLAACVSHVPETQDVASAQSSAFGWRLDDAARPLSYQLELVLRPERARFDGHAGIEVQLAQPRDALVLHGTGLDVREAAVWLADGERLAARYRESGQGDGIAVLELPREISPQRLRIELSWSAEYSQDLEGLYQVHEAGESYLFTQFEPIAARRMMPAFDEPRFKTPWEITLLVPRGQTVIGNTAEIERIPLENGLDRVRFARTAALPTYLLALAVGPLDVVAPVAVPPAGVRERPLALRGVTVRGKGRRMRYALETAAGLLPVLEEYFGTPYPYEKLDLVAVPDFSAGAMENAGAITFRESILFADEASGARAQRRLALVMAHELAHQWFGNLVTMPWWDDLWLNESFASWMETRAVDLWAPEQRAFLSALQRRQRAMEADSFAIARRIREPVRDAHDLENAFDSITYGKGAAVIAMFERFLGADTFRAGVREYLRRHAGGNADADDFLDALTEAAGRDIRAAFRSFLDQPGVPMLEMALSCTTGEARVRFKQSRFVPLGATVAAQGPWHVPVCLRHGREGEQAHSCRLLEEASGSFGMNSGVCPWWLMPNAGFDGYYHWVMPASAYAALRGVRDDLSGPEQLSVVDSLYSAFRGGFLDSATAIERLADFSRSPLPQVALAPLPVLRFATEQLLADPLAVDNARRYARELYAGERAERAFDPQHMSGLAGDVQRLYLSELAAFLAFSARDRDIREEATRRAVAWLGSNREDRSRVLPAESLLTALSIAAQGAVDVFFEALLAQTLGSDDGAQRETGLMALARADTPERADRIRALALDPALRTSEIYMMLREHAKEPRNRESLWYWLRWRFEEVAARLPGGRAAQLPLLAQGLCSKQHAQELRTFFAERIGRYPGGPRNLEKAIEAIEVCVATIERHRAATERFFSDGG